MHVHAVVEDEAAVAVARVERGAGGIGSLKSAPRLTVCVVEVFGSRCCSGDGCSGGDEPSEKRLEDE